MAALQGVGRKGLTAMLLAAVAMTSSPALAASDATTDNTEVPLVTAVAQVDVPPVTIPVKDAVDQALPPGTVSVELPSVAELVEPLVQTLTPARPAPVAVPTPSSASAQSSPSASAPASTGSTGSVASAPRPSGAPPAASVGGSAVVRLVEPTDVDLSQAALRTAGRFWVALAIAAALIAFLTLQWFVDRRDPKLAGSPLSDEVLGFS